MVKRLIAGLLTVVMLLGIIPTAAFATNPENQTSVNPGDVSIEGTNGFGTLLSEEITENQETTAAEAEEYEDGYTVTDLVIEGSTATVTYDSLEGAILVVALYSEDGMQLLTSATAEVTAEDTEVTVTFDGEMPEYFQASAYLVDIYDLSPLCSAYDTPLYTREMQELLASTVEDYDAGRVLNLDDSNSTNFAVYAEDTVVIEEQAGVNTVASVNDDTATYVIENADESITGLQAGDVFAYPYGENDILIVKVASITVDGTTATITGEKLEMEEVFQAVKIDGTSGTADITVDDSTAGEGITYAGLEGNAGSEVRTFAIQGGDTTTASHRFEIQIEAKESTGQTSASLAVSGSLNIEMGVSVKYYISAKTKYVEFKVTPSSTFALTINASVALSDKLGYLAVSPFPGVYVGFEPEIQLKFTGKTSLNVTLDSTIGFKFDTDSGVQNISKSPDVDVKVTIDGTIFVGIDFCPKVRILDDTITKIEVNMLVGVEIKASTSGYAYEAYEKGSDTYHQCRECVAMNIQFKASLGGTLQFLSQDWLTVKITIGEWKVPLGEMYYSVDNDEFDIGKCPNLTYRVTIEVKDKEKNPIPNQEVTVSTLDEPLVTNENGVAVFYSRAETIKVRAEKDGYFNANAVIINSATKIALQLIRTASSAGGGGGSGNGSGDSGDWRDEIDFGGILGTVDSEEITDHGTIVDSGTCGENVSWKLYSDGLLDIYGSGAMKDYGFISDVPWYSLRSKVTSVVIEVGVTSISARAFQDCSSLTSITIPEGVTSIGGSTFHRCRSLTSITIPDSVTSIEDFTFLYCSSLTSISIPDSVTSIGDSAFQDCSSLTSITLPSSLTSIGNYAFGWCSSLTSVTIPDSVTSIGDGAFKGCSSLISAGPIGGGYSYEFGWTDTIPANAFDGCSSLTSITIPEGVTGIGESAFYDCSSLTSVTIPDSVTSIANDTFYGCSSLTSVTIPDSVTSIANDTFYGCSSLTNVTIPDGVTSIGDEAFYNCSSLTSVTLPSSLTSIGHCVFDGCSSLTSVTIPDSVTSIGESAFCGCSSLTSVTIPDSVTSIGSYAFSGCSNLTSAGPIGGGYNIEFGWDDTVPEYAFGGCRSLTSVTIPDGVMSIGDEAFYNCSSLTSVTLPSSLTSIGDDTFRACSSLTSITIPDGVTSIGDYAFYDCSGLTSIHIPNSVTSIGRYAFDNCISLTDVYYSGTAEQWAAISIGSYNRPLKNATIHYNSTGPNLAAESLTAENNTPAAVQKDEEPEVQGINEETAPEGTEPVIENSTSQEAPTVDAIYGGEYDTETTETYTLKTASFTGLVPGEQYVLLALVSLEAENPLASENLLFIDQAEALEDGTLCFRYVQRENTEISYVVACGASNKNLKDAEITFPGMTADGELQAVDPTVVYDGKTLTEGLDYTIVGTVSFSEPGTYTCGIRGIHNYTGLVTCTYRVNKDVVDSGTCGDTLAWELDSNGTLTISGTGDMADYEQGSAPWYSYADQIITIVVENGVASIGDNAFWECGKVTDVNLPDDSLINIGGCAFASCAGLESIQIPDSVVTIEDLAFVYTGLSEVNLSANLQHIGLAPFGGSQNLRNIYVDDDNRYGIYDIDGVLFVKLSDAATPDGRVVNDILWAFPGGRTDSVYRIPEGISATFQLCFVESDNLTRIEFPGDVVGIDADCFVECDNLREISFEGDAPWIFDGAFDGVTATAYYPANNETWTSDVMQDYGGTVTWVPYSNTSDPTVTYKSASISLAGDIGVNYYVQLSDDIVADEGSYMQFTVAGQTQTIPVSQAVTKTEDDGSVTYRFSCKVAAKQMTDTIVGQMYTSNGPVGASKSYSVRAYCDAAIKSYSENEAYASLVALMRDMLNYGAYSQIQFEYNAENLANAGLEDTTLPELTADNLAAYAHGATGSEEGISISSVSLLLESTTTIRFYFKLDGTKTIDEYNFYVDGTEVEPVQYDENTYYVDKANVAAKDLDEMATVTVGGLTAQYCGLSYVRQVAVLYPSNYGENLVNVAKALYAYNQAANTYFGA